MVAAIWQLLLLVQVLIYLGDYRQPVVPIAVVGGTLLFRALQPRRYGGYELDPATFYQAVMEVGTVCGSSAWILGVIGVHNWHLAIFPPQAQEDVWGEDTSVQLSTSLAPTGTVERVDGGFRLSGRWSFSSGCDFQWIEVREAKESACRSKQHCQVSSTNGSRAALA